MRFPALHLPPSGEEAGPLREGVSAQLRQVGKLLEPSCILDVVEHLVIYKDVPQSCHIQYSAT